MVDSNPVVERLTHMLSLLIKNQNHGTRTNSTFVDCPVSSQAIDALAVQAWSEAKPIIDEDTGRVLVRRSQRASSALGLRLKDLFEESADDFFEKGSYPLWLRSVCTYAVAEVDWVDLAEQWISCIDECMSRCGEATKAQAKWEVQA